MSETLSRNDCIMPFYDPVDPDAVMVATRTHVKSSARWTVPNTIGAQVFALTPSDAVADYLHLSKLFYIRKAMYAVFTDEAYGKAKDFHAKLLELRSKVLSYVGGDSTEFIQAYAKRVDVLLPYYARTSVARYLELVKLYFDYMLTPVAENDYVMSAETFQELRERTCWDCANTIYPFLTNQTK